MADNAGGAPPDQKVKELLDASTRAELERWFGMPSFERLAEAPAPPPPELDAETKQVRKRRADAIAAVDPAMIEWHRKRTTPPPDLVRFKQLIDVCVDPDVTMFDYAMLERQHTVSEPIEREIPNELIDDLADRTPQALLRDLHRPELNFTKQFEVTDIVAEMRVDAAAVVADVIKARYGLPKSAGEQIREARALIDSLRDDRHRPWTEIQMPNRRHSE